MLKDTFLKFLKLDGVLDTAKDYAETRLELLKIEIKEDVARLLSKAFLVLLLTFSFALFIILLSVGIVYYLGSLVGMVGGFLIMAGFYLLLSLVLLLFRKNINQLLEKQFTELARQKSK